MTVKSSGPRTRTEDIRQSEARAKRQSVKNPIRGASAVALPTPCLIGALKLWVLITNLSLHVSLYKFAHEGSPEQFVTVRGLSFVTHQPQFSIGRDWSGGHF